MLSKQKIFFKGLFSNNDRPLTPAKCCSHKLTFKHNKDSSKRLKKQTATGKVETAGTCWSRAGQNFRTRPETGLISLQRARWRFPSSACCSVGHCWEGQRPVFVSSLPRVLLLARATPCDTHLLSPCLPEFPLYSPFRLWSCFLLIKISLHTERT